MMTDTQYTATLCEAGSPFEFKVYNNTIIPTEVLVAEIEQINEASDAIYFPYTTLAAVASRTAFDGETQGYIDHVDMICMTNADAFVRSNKSGMSITFCDKGQYATIAEWLEASCSDSVLVEVENTPWEQPDA